MQFRRTLPKVLPIENRQASNSASMLKTLEIRLDEPIIADPLGSCLNWLKGIKLVHQVEENLNLHLSQHLKHTKSFTSRIINKWTLISLSQTIVTGQKTKSKCQKWGHASTAKVQMRFFFCRSFDYCLEAEPYCSPSCQQMFRRF